MSFSFNKTGPVIEVQDELQKITQHDDLGQKTQEFVLNVLDMQSDKVDTVTVAASGHSDATYAAVNVSVTVEMKHGHGENQ